MWSIVGGAVLLVVLVLGLVVWRTRGRKAKGDIISVVSLRRSHRALTEADVRQAARRAFSADVKVERLPSPGNSRLFVIVKDDVPPIGVIDVPDRYDVDVNGATKASVIGHEHPEVRAAMAAHTAWLSVDAMGITSDQVDSAGLQAVQKLLARLLYEFIDDDSLLLYETAGGLFGASDAAASEKLKQGDIAGLFGNPDMQEPMINIATNDDEIEAAIQEAKRRLPQFRRAVGTGRCSKAIVKGGLRTSEGAREYIWLSVIELTPDGFRARIENNPIDEALPKRGSVIELKTEDVVDWACRDESGRPQGGFVERILLKRMRQG